MLVKVTQEHIDKARQLNSTEWRCASCPVALSLIDTFKVNEVHTAYSHLRVGTFPENLIFDVPTPEEVTKWMLNFDKSLIPIPENSFPVQPFEFELSLEGVKL